MLCVLLLVLLLIWSTFLAFRALDMGNKWGRGDVGYIRECHVPWTIWYLLLVKKDLTHFAGLGTWDHTYRKLASHSVTKELILHAIN